MPGEMDLTEVARAMNLEKQPRTVKRWLRAWLDLGVPGIRKVPARGRNGFRYAVSPDLITRWLDCQLPAPRAPVTRGTQNEAHASTQQAVLSATG